MHHIHSALVAMLCAGAMATVSYAEQKNAPASQSGHASTYSGVGQQHGESASAPAARSSGAGLDAEDCPSGLARKDAERVDPPGPVGQSGSASAMVDDSGTLGSTGSTRATSTSGATGTIGEEGSYAADPSGSVTEAGSTGAPIDQLAQCDDLPAATTGGSGDDAMQNSQPSKGQATSPDTAGPEQK